VSNPDSAIAFMVRLRTTRGRGVENASLIYYSRPTSFSNSANLGWARMGS
jgi:hypothetical protein